MKPVIDRLLTTKRSNLWTGTYIKIPTEVSELLDSEYEREQRMGRILFFFFRKVYFKDGAVKYLGQMYACMRGEYIGSMKQLSQACDIPEGSIYRYLKMLERDRFISLRRLKCGMLVGIVGYDDFMKGTHLSVKENEKQHAETTTEATDSSTPATTPAPPLPKINKP